MLLILSCVAAVDLSSPKSAAKSLYVAVESSDREGLITVLDVPHPEHQPLVEALADLIIATRKMGDAARKTFGDAGEKLSAGTNIPEDLKQLEAAQVVEKDGVATITIANQLAPLKFVNRDGAGKLWKLDISDYYKAHDDLAAQTKLVRNMTEQWIFMTDDLLSGKFSTPVEAETALQQRFNEVMIKSVSPSTQPTTTPGK
jgi:hypothetical protein